MQAEHQLSENERRRAFGCLLRKKRTEKGLSINELARQADIAKSNLARLEAGDGNPSLETLWALSAALKINVRELIEPVTGGMRLSRATQLFDAYAEAAHFGVALLSTCPVGALRDIYRATFQPGDAKLSSPHSVGTIEHVILLTGKARIGSTSSPEILSPGDYMTFSADQRHFYEALEPDTTAIIIMESA